MHSSDKKGTIQTVNEPKLEVWEYVKIIALAGRLNRIMQSQEKKCLVTQYFRQLDKLKGFPRRGR